MPEDPVKFPGHRPSPILWVGLAVVVLVALGIWLGLSGKNNATPINSTATSTPTSSSATATPTTASATATPSATAKPTLSQAQNINFDADLSQIDKSLSRADTNLNNAQNAPADVASSNP